MMRLAAECQKVLPEVISDVQHLKSISGRHISHVSLQFVYAFYARLFTASTTRDVHNSKT